MKKRNSLQCSFLSPSCKNCGATELSKHVYADTVDFRGLQLDVEGLQSTMCNICKFRFETVEQEQSNASIKRNAYSLERDRIRVRDGLLSGEEIATIRKAYDLSQRDAAMLFGGGANAFNKYETGEVLQSAAMDRLLRVSAHFGRPVIKALTCIVDAKFISSDCFGKNPKVPNTVSIVMQFQDETGDFAYHAILKRPASKAAAIKIVSDTTFIEGSNSIPSLYGEPVYMIDNSAEAGERSKIKLIESLQ